MKHLKRTLCMILALTMMLSLCVFSASAVDIADGYTDESEIENKEAVTVLSGIGVLQGYEGLFRPKDGLTRAEGCTIVAKLLGHGNYSGKSGFSDMNEAAWADGVVAYCKSIGIVHGVGNNAFAPNKPLTGSAFAKMLICALGYDAESEGVLGSKWETATAKLVSQIGLADGMTEFIGSEAISRENAALLALNTLKATMVEYSGKIQVNNAGVSFTVNGSRTCVPAIGADYTGNKDNSTCEFCEFYFKNLKLRQNTENAYGRPASHQWVLNGKVIYTGQTGDTCLKTYTESVRTGTLYELIGKDAYDAIKNGEAVFTAYIDGEKTESAVSDYFVKNGIGYAMNSGIGVLTEIYTDEAYNTTVVQISTYLAKAVDNYSTAGNELDIEVFGSDRLGYETLSGDDFNVKDCKRGDWLLITVDGGAIASVQPAETVKGKLEGYTSEKSVTVAGSTYTYAAAFDTTEFKQKGFAVGGEMTLILDKYGHILGLEAEEAEPQILYVLEIAKSSSLIRSGYEASVILPDGKYSEITVKSVDGRTPDESDSGWFGYTTGSAGSYSLIGVENAISVEGFEFSLTSGRIQFVRMEQEYLTEFLANASTKFIVMDAQDDCRIYTGYAKVPSVNTDNQGSIRIDAICDENGFAQYVFVSAGEALTEYGKEETEKQFFVYSEEYSVSVDQHSKTYYTYSAISGDKVGLVNVNAPLAGTGLYTFSGFDADGYLNADTVCKVTADNEKYTVHTELTGKAAYSNGILCIDNAYYILSENCLIYTISGENNVDVCTAGHFVSCVKSGTVSAVYGVFENGSLISLYALSTN